ncbi:MAG: CO dehydrogenase/CO-methylating acetyl-CoA synthase complex subunit beta, partial [Chloroflexota bacterium]|nr:CO dehydrogenase/CO-methylating acetyl-CoA synthase complex subunit beta [Chloroflexota bacterium]
MTNTIDIFNAAASSDDAEVRRQGIGFIDGSIPGYALLLGADAGTAAPLIESLTRRKILVFVADGDARVALREAGQPLGWDSGVVHLKLPDALGFIVRVAQFFGNPETPEEALSYARQRLRGFTLLLGAATPERLAEAQAALPLGCPLLNTADLPPAVDDWEIPAECRPATGGLPLADIVQLGIEERGLQIRIPLTELPVAYSPDFSGQVVRDEACGACLTGVELTVTGEDIVDGRVTIVGPDLDAAVQGEQPYAMLIEVSGRAMQSDFEPVLERQVETMFNDADGIMHRGQRTIVTLRVAQKAIDKGLRLRHLGVILHARYHNEYGNILSRVQITFFTEPAQVQTLTERAQAIYAQRDHRLSSLTDEDVDTFYTCNLCQTIAAGHLCVISPEHPGACGAVDWMDARAAVSIRPVGPNKVVTKEGLLDAKLGQWKSVNQIVQQESGGAIEAYSLYSLMQDPGSACGDFECITAMLPLSNGVMVMSHEYEGMTPSGMDWAMLYEVVGAGAPVPGFLGHSKRALQRDKFISAEGGWRRIVWMNHTLREELRP